MGNYFCKGSNRVMSSASINNNKFMKIIQTIAEIKKEIQKIKQQDLSIGLVPTMGCIHEAHLQLVNDIKKHSNVSIVTIFTNPKQFNNPDDYKNYPRTLDGDVKKLRAIKNDIIFVPDAKEIYPEKNLLDFKLNKMNDCLCAVNRKGHFEGVITIIFKLFNIISPDYVIFGEKDFQQLQIIKKAASDFNFKVKILSSPAIRQENGLVFSSRNKRLSPKDLKIALNISKVLKQIKKKIISGKNIKDILLEGKNILLEKGFDSVDYLDFRDEENLKNISFFDQKTLARVFVAAKINNVRLIDNLKINSETEHKIPIGLKETKT
jgi:pantoate--beta-alanine ligase